MLSEQGCVVQTGVARRVTSADWRGKTGGSLSG